MSALLLVALFGGLGAATRFVVDGSVRARWSRSLPVATLVVNVSGSALIGLLAGAVTYRELGPEWSVPVMAGFCGGYTTFSTAMVETVRLVQAGQVRVAVVNALGTTLACVVAAALGIVVVAVTA
ncbi:fluoride efflux transporter CrcB [Actinotalea sp.]|uniref:fluoride efflux transporter CrcB n=1 Tax=Actinotalea sp. TaxID=1872145 RepID=UPI0035631373